MADLGREGADAPPDGPMGNAGSAPEVSIDL